jgi:hypothetical protein
VDVFEAALEGRIPDSTLLSHDLLEGIFARAGLVSDIEVVEEFPSRYDVAAARQHRWARGDWQLLPWIMGCGRDSTDGSAKTAIPLICRWKMIDNLRRTLSAPATFFGLPAGWTLPATAAAIWSVFVLAAIAARLSATLCGNCAATIRDFEGEPFARGGRGPHRCPLTSHISGHAPSASRFPNLGSTSREIEVTSYAEIVLTPPAADAAHPAFSKLFVQTEFVSDMGGLIATRRPRSPDENSVWAAHLVVAEGETLCDLQFETDRAAFYQASGAYRFRDQLQDVMDLTVSQPGVAREHLVRAAGRQFLDGDALDVSLAVGDHGLPLTGRGDWNDGMNRVGENGKGQGVWLGWFLA